MPHDIREGADGRFHVTFIVHGQTQGQKSFATLNRAKAWASRCEAAAAHYSGSDEPLQTVDNTSLSDIVLRYGREVSVLKKGATAEQYRVNAISESSLGGLLLKDVTSKALATYRNARLRSVSNSAVRNELSIIRRSIEYARREWGFDIPVNPASLVTLPRPSLARDRRLLPGEYEKLEAQLKRNKLVWAFVRFAIHSAMRRGEMLSMKWRQVDIPRRIVRLPVTKSGSPRTVPLTDGALEVLMELDELGENVFPIDIHALRWAWNGACKKAEINGLRLHDLRHEGVSRLFEMELSVPEVALISGHKTASMLFRYTHLMPTELARKLKGRKRRIDPI